MTLDQYLERFIEGYLFGDLQSMAAFRLPAGQQWGNLNYPMLMTALAGIEVLGVLTSRAPYKPEHGAGRFREFWRDYVYVDRPAFGRLDSVAYEFIRHGLAHSFITKPMVVVTKNQDPRHLHRRNDHVLCIDAVTLADDLRTAYFDRLKPKIAGDFKTDMEARFLEFREAGWEHHDAKKNDLLKAPLQPYDGKLIIRVAGPPVSSPSLGPSVRYSTNISTTDFDDPNQ
jgi:hypothetical protein